MAQTAQRETGGFRQKRVRGRPSNRSCGVDGTGEQYRGPSSWQRLRFNKRDRVRDHRRISLLVETGQCQEKFIYDWELNRRQVGEQRQARRLLRRLPARTKIVSADPNYDAYKVYDTIESQGAKPVIKPRKNAKRGTIDARGRAIRRWDRSPKTRKRLYGRRVITESVNPSIKRRFGRRLCTHGIIRQRKEFGFRVIAYNTSMVHRAKIRFTLTRRH